jgi:type III pantothenate kinase
MALLAIDVGNTQTAFGLFEGPELREHWRVATERNRSGDELGALYGSFLDRSQVEGIARDGLQVARLVRGGRACW